MSEWRNSTKIDGTFVRRVKRRTQQSSVRPADQSSKRAAARVTGEGGRITPGEKKLSLEKGSERFSRETPTSRWLDEIEK